MLDAVHFRLIHDLDFEVAELDINLVQVRGADQILRERLVDIAIGQVTLLLGQADQFLDLLGDIDGRVVSAARPCEGA